MASLSHKANRKKNPVPRLSWTIYEFCAAVGISRSTYEKLKRQGRHPREMKIGKAVRISQAAAAQWVAAQEAASRPEVAA
jgi:predicted DNA-binding transcriptional regulator AlpA